MKTPLLLASVLLVFGAACRKSEPNSTPASNPVSAALSMPPASGSLSDSSVVLDPGISEEQRDRRLMVRPAAPDFKPKADGHLLEVRLIPEAPRIRLGSPLRVRLEVQNVGTRTWRYVGEHSLLKSFGSTDNDWRHWRFYATAAGGVRIELQGALSASSLVEPQVMEPSAAERLAERARAFRYLRVDLGPGETILSTRRSSDVADDWAPTETDRYVEVANRHEFKNPGVYVIEAEHVARRINPSTGDFDPESTFRSPPIRVEVRP